MKKSSYVSIVCIKIYRIYSYLVSCIVIIKDLTHSRNLIAPSLNDLAVDGTLNTTNQQSDCILYDSFFAGENLVVTEKQDSIFLIGLNRPKKRNAVNPATAQQLRSAFKQFEDNKDLLVAVLYGKGQV